MSKFRSSILYSLFMFFIFCLFAQSTYLNFFNLNTTVCLTGLYIQYLLHSFTIHLNFFKNIDRSVLGLRKLTERILSGCLEVFIIDVLIDIDNRATWHQGIVRIQQEFYCVSVVPAQVQSLVGPAAKGRWLGGVVACGAGKCVVQM